jgi:hypothetical protein
MVVTLFVTEHSTSSGHRFTGSKFASPFLLDQWQKVAMIRHGSPLPKIKLWW